MYVYVKVNGDVGWEISVLLDVSVGVGEEIEEDVIYTSAAHGGNNGQ